MAILTEEELKVELEAFKETCDNPEPKGMDSYYKIIIKTGIGVDLMTTTALISWLNRAELQKEKDND